MDALGLLILLFVLALLLAAVVLPIVALVISIRTKNKLTRQITALGSSQISPVVAGDPHLVAAIHRLQTRVSQLEAAVGTQPEQPRTSEELPVAASDQEPEPAVPQSPSTRSEPAREPPPMFAHVTPVSRIDAFQLESMIGRRWVGWAAIALILFAAAFFLKYAFDNRWIGELGRVSIGVAAGVALTVLGFRYHHRGWRVFSQILTAGGVVLLYLSAYAAFGYYHLVTQKAAFIYLGILVAEAAGLALVYNAPAIAIMALIGGFLSPLLLHSDRDQYRSLFGYIVALDVGALALLKHWHGLSSLAFAGTHLLFWIWYADRYHPRKLAAVMTFHAVVFLLFLIAHIARRIVRSSTPSIEDLALLLLNPFVFFATSYHLLNPWYHDWMGVFATGMALVYAGATKLLLDRSSAKAGEALILIGVAITFVTLAIPIQLRSNWITIAWAVEALVVLWTGIETKTKRLHGLSWILFALALGKAVFWDAPGEVRPVFIPVFNRYFLSSLFVVACLFGAAWLYRRLDTKETFAPKLKLVAALIGVVGLWFLMSIEVHTFFATRAAAQKIAEDVSNERWLGQMALSVLWAVYAAALATIGFVRRSAGARWAALILFGIAIVKAMIVDIAYLQQLYRIIVFFVLGVLLLLVAWAYHRAFYSRETGK
jgi:uncharacterized membrane protein